VHVVDSDLLEGAGDALALDLDVIRPVPDSTGAPFGVDDRLQAHNALVLGESRHRGQPGKPPGQPTRQEDERRVAVACLIVLKNSRLHIGTI
jgi:hypothetical protein